MTEEERDIRTLRDFLNTRGTTEATWKALDRVEARLKVTPYEAPKSDVQIIRERLECAKSGTTTDALEALARLEAKLPTPAYETGFYVVGLSAVYWYNAMQDQWWDVIGGYTATDYPTRLPRKDVVRLYRASEVGSLA